MSEGQAGAGRKRLVFQRVVEELGKRPQEDGDADDFWSLVFFELANVPLVGYQIPPNNEVTITVQQDMTACGKHTGGIVWETSYLLLNYLLAQQKQLGKVLEVGAGCGLLGQVLAASGISKAVVLTETSAAMENLQSNLGRNAAAFGLKSTPTAQKLDWIDHMKDASDACLEPQSFDTLVGTDVIFTSSLVEPLLATLSHMAKAETGIVFLCLQVRCKDSHDLFLAKSKNYGWQVDDVTEHLSSIEDCQWGLAMECCLLKLLRIPGFSAPARAVKLAGSKKKKRHRKRKACKQEDQRQKTPKKGKRQKEREEEKG